MAGIDTFYNVVNCEDGICLEYDCSSREFVAVTLNLRVINGGEVCYSLTGFQSVEQAVEFLLSRGVPKHRIAVEGRPLALEFSRPKGSTAYVCPVCGSRRIKNIGIIGLTPIIYVCENCGYRGSLILEVEL